ncbi:hypothetical protein DOY81_002671 [Sarcophaga bullata]|nr:hypothetical protein DOY81_002671 [Sarcophaga bullata]
MLFSCVVGFIMLIGIQTISGRHYEECEGIQKLDVVVASKKSCAKYIFCAGENSYEGECLAGNYFNVKEEVCDDPENVECNIQPSDDVKSIYDEDYTQPPELQGNNNGEEDEEDENEDENDSETNDELNDNREQSHVANIASANMPKCPHQMGYQNIKHIANPESCVAFYACYNGMAIAMLCPAKMYFNEETGKCETQMPSSCKSKHAVSLKCHKGVYNYLPHPNRCEYYYYCMDGFLLIMRCPYDFTWHYEQSTCVHKSQSKCYFEHNTVIYQNNN